MAALLLLVLACALAKTQAEFMHGVSFGGWQLMETSWMYDQFNYGAENDFVRSLREQHNDSFAVQTMLNHWSGYIPDEMLDLLASKGFEYVRIPLGYWIFDTPVDTPNGTYYDTGFNSEGFVTGGASALKDMLGRLKSRGMRAFLDIHAVPGGGSRCQSYSGWQVQDDGASFWKGGPSNAPSPCSGSGPYNTSRDASQSWMTIGEQTLLRAADFIAGLQDDATLRDTVFGLELVNEPGLGWSGLSYLIQKFVSETASPVAKVLQNASVRGSTIVLNFIGANEQGAGAWVRQQVDSGQLPNNTVIDYHQYYNWDGQKSQAQLLDMVCTQQGGGPWQQYADANLSVLIGEWSLASNLDDPQFENVDNPDVRAFLSKFFADQVSLWQATTGVVGQFYWTARMGSGWEPRPTPEYPHGHQVPNTSYKLSQDGFRYRVWNLAEMLDLGIAQSPESLKVTGTCQCNGCATKP